MATATPSSRCGAIPGCSSASCSNSCFTDVAETWISATPPVSCARFPTRTTRAIPLVATLPQRLQHLGRRHGELGEADAGGVLHRVGDGAERRDDRRLADAAHAERVLGI